jgi:regulatory protein
MKWGLASGSSQPDKADRMSRLPSLSLKGRALKYLAAREHSRVELTRKLAAYAESPEQIQSVLDELQAKGLLSEQRFTDSVVHRKSARFGAARMQAELSQHQLPPEMAREAVERLRESEFDRAHALWLRRYGEPSVDSKEKIRRTRFLMGRGFSSDVVRRVVKGEGLSNQDM